MHELHVLADAISNCPCYCTYNTRLDAYQSFTPHNIIAHEHHIQYMLTCEFLGHKVSIELSLSDEKVELPLLLLSLRTCKPQVNFKGYYSTRLHLIVVSSYSIVILQYMYNVSSRLVSMLTDD